MDDGGNDYGGEENWNWVLSGDLFFNGVIFESFGVNGGVLVYNKVMSLLVCLVFLVEIIISDLGFFMCIVGV